MTLARLGSSRVKMVGLSPAFGAGEATPCAWFPAEAATTPALRSAAVKWWTLLSAPRTLKEPVRWKFSSLRCTSAPVICDRLLERFVGVRSEERRVGKEC